MQYFLQEAAKDIYGKYGDKLSDICFVFPNRRSGMFFKNYLAKEIQEPVWSPSIVTINDLMQQLSGLQKADQLSLVFNLFQVYKKEKKSQEPFDEFYTWGEMLLRDFDDVDKYLVDPQNLFRNVANLKSIENQFSYLSEEQIAAIRKFWDTLNVKQFSKEQNDFISIWEILYEVYIKYNQLLDEKQQAYEGKIYRAVADRIDSNTLETGYKKYVLIGFNALTPAEKKLFSILKNSGKAEFYWDYDKYYLNEHEAGRFINQNMKDFPGKDLQIHDHLGKDKNIQFVNTPYDLSQAKILPELLDGMTGENDNSPDKTAIILPDEHLLLPVLNSLPTETDEINVTMGYPVYLTPAFSFLLSLIGLQENARKIEGEIQFYYKDVLSVLNHQYLGIIRDENAEALIERIHQHNKIYLPVNELRINSLYHSIFGLPETYQSLSDYLLENYYKFYLLLKERSDEENQSLKLERENIYQVYLAIKRLKEIFIQQDAQVKAETYLRILERVINNQKIPFQGEPLSGIQVMGILETRALDFENLIILSMNEGTLPKAESSPSFIPFSLRKGFGLPTYEQEDAIYAYYFYRLIQRAQNITLVYNSSTNGIKTGEMSRFMYQLKFESGFSITEHTVVSDINVPDKRYLQVDKTSEIMNLLEKYNTIQNGDKELSPSALNTYLRCSLQFYYKYIAGLREPDEVTEDVDLPLFGSILHKAIQLLYEHYRQNQSQITVSELQKLEKNGAEINNKIMEAFRQEYFSDHPKDKRLDLSGKNLLIKDIIHQYIKQFLSIEQRFAPFLPLSLEREYKTSVDFNVRDKRKQVVFRGNIDRVDEVESGIRIIDYKTGQPKQSFRDLSSLFEKNGNDAALQALIYSRMYWEANKPGKDLLPGLYFFRRIYQDDFDWSLKMNNTPLAYFSVKDDFDSQLQEKLAEVFDPDVPFSQTDDLNICRLCPYAGICRRD
jgi:hypothetical protein